MGGWNDRYLQFRPDLTEQDVHDSFSPYVGREVRISYAAAHATTRLPIRDGKPVEDAEPRPTAWNPIMHGTLGVMDGHYVLRDAGQEQWLNTDIAWFRTCAAEKIDGLRIECYSLDGRPKDQPKP